MRRIRLAMHPRRVAPAAMLASTDTCSRAAAAAATCGRWRGRRADWRGRWRARIPAAHGDGRAAGGGTAGCCAACGGAARRDRAWAVVPPTGRRGAAAFRCQHGAAAAIALAHHRALRLGQDDAFAAARGAVRADGWQRVIWRRRRRGRQPGRAHAACGPCFPVPRAPLPRRHHRERAELCMAATDDGAFRAEQPHAAGLGGCRSLARAARHAAYRAVGRPAAAAGARGAARAAAEPAAAG
mmetsp:Transcript_20007/g.59444  ORF Transcript_20007/g.59444 Transcript_20007/m.59444 type:complete len:241 (+) Transcript_20007:510-1232(+)